MTDAAVRTPFAERGENQGPDTVDLLTLKGPLVMTAPEDLRPVSVGAGATISEILDRASAPASVRAGGRVLLIDPKAPDRPLPVPRDVWHVVRPKPGTVVLAGLVPTGGGGGGGKKSPLRTVLTLAVVVASFYVGGAIGASQFASSFSFSAFGTSFNLLGIAASAATSLVGNALVNAIAPVGPPSISQAAAFAAAPDQTLYSINGVRNRSRPYEPWRTVIGRMRVFPDANIETYTEVEGNRTFLRVLLEVGYGPLQIEDIRIGETPISAFKGVEIEIREGWADDDPITLYTDDSAATAIGSTLTQVSSWHTRNAAPDADEIFWDIGFTRGLARITENNGRAARTIEFDVEIAPVGTEDWEAVQWANSEDDGTFATDGKVFVTDALLGSEVRRTGRIKTAAHGGRGQYRIRCRRVTADTSANNIVDTALWNAVRAVTYRAPIAATGIAQIALRIEGTEQLQRVLDTVNCIATSYLKCWDDGAGEFVWRLSREPADAFQHVLFGPANKRPQPQTMVNHGNLAAWAVDNQALNANGNVMFTFDAIYERRVTVRDVLNDVCASARARLSMPDGKWGVVRDLADLTPRQCVTPSNSVGFTEVEAYTDLPHALLVKFNDAEAGWRINQVAVPRGGYTLDPAAEPDLEPATDFEVAEFIGVTRHDQAVILGRYHLGSAEFRPSKVKTRMGLEFLDFGRGDMVLACHPVVGVGLGDGFIDQVLVDVDENITAIVLDETIEMVNGVAYGVTIRRARGSERFTDTLIVRTEPGETDTLTFWDNDLNQAAPLAPSVNIAVDDFFIFGAAELVAGEYICQNLEPQGADGALVSLVAAAPEVLTPLSEPLPVRQAVLAAAPRAERRPKPPVVVGVAADESAVHRLPGGQPVSRIVVTVAPPDLKGPVVEFLDVTVRETDQSLIRRLAPLPAGTRRVEIGDVTDGKDYVVTLANVGTNGVPSEAVTRTITVTGQSARPPAPTAVLVERLPGGGYRYRILGEDPGDLKGWRIRHVPGVDRTWERGVAAHTGVHTADTFDATAAPAGTFTVLVKAVDWALNESAAPTAAIVNLGTRPTDPALATTDLAAAGFPGSVVGGGLNEGDLVADVTGTLFTDPSQPLFTDADDPLATAHEAMTYTHSFSPEYRGHLNVSVLASAGTTVSYTIAGEGPLFTNPAEALFVDPADPLYETSPPAVFQGPFLIQPGVDYQVVVAVPGGTEQGRISGLTLTVAADVEHEYLNDVEISSDGSRLPVAAVFETILNVGLTLQSAEGYPATKAKVMDKNPSQGPLIQGWDDAGVPSAALIDADLWGILKT